MIAGLTASTTVDSADRDGFAHPTIASSPPSSPSTTRHDG